MADATFTMKVRMDSGDLSVDLREIVQDFGSFKQDFRRISEGLTKEISKLSESLKNFTPDSKYVKSVGQTFADDIKRSLNPVRLMSGIVSGTFAGVVRNWIKEMFGDKTKDFLKSSFTTLTGVATKGLDEIVKIFKEGIPALMENFKHQLGVWKILMKPYLSEIKKGAIGTLNKTKEILGNIAKYISTIFKNAVTSVGTYLTKIKTSIGRYLTKIKASITKAVTALKKALLPKLKLLLGPKGLILAAVIGLVTFIAKNWDEIKEAALAVWDAVTEFAQNALQTIQEIWGAVAEWFSTTIISPLKSTFSDAWESIRDFAISAWEGVSNAVLTSWDTVTSIVRNSANTILGDQRKGQNIEAPLSTIEDAVSNVYHSIAATAA